MIHQLLQCPWLQQVQQYWDYTHISHTWWTKKKVKYPHHLKGQNRKQIRDRGKQRKPQVHRQNPPKAQEADETYTYDSPNSYYHNDIYTYRILLVLSTRCTFENSKTFNALCDVNPEVLLQV